MDDNEVCQIRKRKRDPSSWKRAQEKAIKYSAKSIPQYPRCGHKNKKWKCSLLKMTDILNFHAEFYVKPDKLSQDSFILKHCSVHKPKRIKFPGERPPKNISLEYSVVNDTGNVMTVCRDTFLEILGIKKHRVIGVFTRLKRLDSLIPIETRGGSRKGKYFDDKKKSVNEFIDKFKTDKFHYCNNSQNEYLNSGFSISGLHKVYNESVEERFRVKESLFRNLFCGNNIINFKSANNDECTKCLELAEIIEVVPDIIKKEN